MTPRIFISFLSALAVLMAYLPVGVTQAQPASRQANGASFDPIVSADGRLVAYESAATNLIDSDTNAKTDIFVADLQTGTTTRVSVSSSGEQADSSSADPFISADGTHVLFESLATNLVPGDTNAKRDIFVHDLGSGQTERLSVSSSGTQANGNSFDPMEEEDGGIVSFSSDATNLVSSDTNGDRDIFVRNRSTNLTTRASVSSSGTQANGDSDHPAVSPDGRYVGFPSEASNLVSSDTNAAWDVFVKDLTGGTTIRVSVGANGQANSDSPARAWMSDFANQITFPSEASNLVSGDTNAVQDIFVRDRLASTTERSSVSSSGSQSNGSSDLPSITSDGRYVGYSSDGSNLVSGDTNAAQDVFVRDRTSKTTVAASVNSSGQLGNEASDRPMIAGAGRYVVFHSAATNLVASDTNALTDVFMRDTTSGTTQLVSMGFNRSPTAQLSVNPEQGDTSTTFTANITASDPDGDVLSYVIEWGDGEWSGSQSASHVYEYEGEFIVSARVTDPFGASATSAKTIKVCTTQISGECVQPPNLPHITQHASRPNALPGLTPVPTSQDCLDRGLGTAAWHNGQPLCGHLRPHPTIDSAQVQAVAESADPDLIAQGSPLEPAHCASGTQNRIEVIYATPKPLDELDREEMQARRELIRFRIARADYFLDASTPKLSGQDFRWWCNSEGQVIVQKAKIIEVQDSYSDQFGACNLREDTPGDTVVSTSDVVCSLRNQQQSHLNPDAVKNFDSGAMVVFLDYPLSVCANEDCTEVEEPPNGEFAGNIGFKRPEKETDELGPAWAISSRSPPEQTWAASNVLHELLHTFGAVPEHNADEPGEVEYESPENTGEGHTYVRWDVMFSNQGIYYDEGGEIDPRCPFPAHPHGRPWWIDCGRNDYYDPNPGPGDFLFEYPTLNIVDNVFLEPFQE